MNNLGLLPEGWAKTKVGGYLHLKNGFAFKSAWYTKKDESTVPVIRISNINGKHASESKAVHVSSDNAAEGFEINNGDLLIAMSGATTGKVGIYSSNTLAYQNQRVGNFKLNSEANGNASYRNYLISNLTPDILKIAYGGAQPNISGKAIEEMDINLPPLAEQKVIANKLNELLTQVESTKARLDAIPAILKSFRQSLLAAAVSGKLTEEWRGEASYEWSEVKLIDVVEKKPRNGRSPQGVNYVTQYRNLTLSATTPGKFVDNKFKYVELDIDDSSHLWVKNGDILIQRGNTIDYVGVSALYLGEDNQYVYPDLMMKCKPSKKVIGKYLHLALLSEGVRKYFRDNATGTAGNMPKINQKTVSEAPFSLPPLDEQTEIVRRVEELFAFADKVEAQVNAAQLRVNNLTQSILAKAFRGELTADWRAANPSLITGDNSAAALLERIKAEREALALAVKAAKKPAKKPRAKKAKA